MRERIGLALAVLAAGCIDPGGMMAAGGGVQEHDEVVERVAPVVPARPGKSVSAAMQDQIAVRWTRAEGRVLGNQIETCREWRTACDTVMVAADTVEAVVDTGQHNTWHQVRVRAWNSGGYGPWSQIEDKPTGPPGVVLAGTVWLLSGILTPDDESAHDSTRHVTTDSSAHRYTAVYGDHQIPYEVALDDSTHSMLETYVPLVGRLPAGYLRSVTKMRLLPGTGSWPEAYAYGCTGVAILTYGADVKFLEGYMEEVMIHEAGHTLHCQSGRNDDPEWVAAQSEDGIFVTAFARDNPRVEDFAEVAWAWFVARCVPDRVHSAIVRAIKESIPNRLAYFDEMGLDMSPYTCGD